MTDNGIPITFDGFQFYDSDLTVVLRQAADWIAVQPYREAVAWNVIVDFIESGEYDLYEQTYWVTVIREIKP